MSATIEVDLRSFVDYAEQEVSYADQHFPPPEPGRDTIARKLCALAFEARDVGSLGTAYLLILLARTLVCASREECEDLIALMTAFDCSQEVIAAWAAHTGTSYVQDSN
jgi:hypothetical protein